MEILTGKAKESFTEYVYKEHAKDASYQHGSFYDLPEICQNALIIEWLDSVDLHIHITYGFVSEKYHWRIALDEGDYSNTNFSSRNDAAKNAIETANTIFNAR